MGHQTHIHKRQEQHIGIQSSFCVNCHKNVRMDVLPPYLTFHSSRHSSIIPHTQLHNSSNPPQNRHSILHQLNPHIILILRRLHQTLQIPPFALHFRLETHSHPEFQPIHHKCHVDTPIQSKPRAGAGPETHGLVDAIEGEHGKAVVFEDLPFAVVQGE